MKLFKFVCALCLLLISSICLMLVGCGPKGSGGKEIQADNYSPVIRAEDISVKYYTTGELHLIYKFTQDEFPMQVPDPSTEEYVRRHEELNRAWQEWAATYTTPLFIEYNGETIYAESSLDNTYRIELFDKCEIQEDGSYLYTNLNESVDTTITQETQISVNFKFSAWTGYVNGKKYNYEESQGFNYTFTLYPTQEKTEVNSLSGDTINRILGQTQGPVNDEASMYDEYQDLAMTFEELRTSDELYPKNILICETNNTGKQWILWTYYPVTYLRLTESKYRVWYKWERVKADKIYRIDTIEFIPMLDDELEEIDLTLKGNLSPVVMTHKTGEDEGDFVNAHLEFVLKEYGEDLPGIELADYPYTAYSPEAFREALNARPQGETVDIIFRIVGCNVEGYSVLPSNSITHFVNLPQ